MEARGSAGDEDRDVFGLVKIEMGHIRNGRHLAIDNRPPASRIVKKAEGEFLKPQPTHQRVRLDHAERLGFRVD